jgi:hypothetical protein
MIEPRAPASLRTVLALACCAFLALVACEHQPMPGVNPTPASAPQAPPPPETVDVTTTTVTTTSSTGTGEEVIAVEETETQTEETQPAVSSEQREADIADCYAFSRSQVQRDIDVQDDSATVVDSTVNPGFTAFTQDLTDYGNEKRRGALFDNCMVAKGYADDGY